MESRKLVHLFFEMLRIRMIEEAIVSLYSEREIRCPVHICIGHEAIAVGVCSNLNQTDLIYSNHRSQAHYLAKGGDINALFAELYGKKTGCSNGIGGSMHLIDESVGFLGATSIVGGTIPVAVGTAFALKFKEKNAVTVAFFGDGASEEGVLHESLNFSKLHNLPIIFVCENNLYSVMTHISLRQPKIRNIADVAAGHGVESHIADGNDVEKIAHLTKNAISKARNGEGPSFFEYKTYRWFEHCGPNYDYNVGYRSEEELNKWKERCPVSSSEKYLVSKGYLTNLEITNVREQIDQEINNAVDFAKKSEYPKREDLLKNIYA